MWKYSIYPPPNHITSSRELPWELRDMVAIAIDGCTVIAGQVDMVTDDINPSMDHEYRITEDHTNHYTVCIVQTSCNTITSVVITHTLKPRNRYGIYSYTV